MEDVFAEAWYRFMRENVSRIMARSLINFIQHEEIGAVSAAETRRRVERVNCDKNQRVHDLSIL